VANAMAKSMKEKCKHPPFLHLCRPLNVDLHRLCRGASVGIPGYGAQSFARPRK
jgi:hypothetical protein